MEPIKELITNITQPYTLEKPAIKECYIAYLDMLGYKAFFEEHPEKVDEMLTALTQAIERVVGRLQMINSMFQISDGIIKDDFKIRVFSDNILVYFEYKQSYEQKFVLLSFIELIKDFQISLIASHCIFVRGGITKGKFAANNMFVFGQGLIDAVTLEEKKAVFPRVIIHQSVIDDLNSNVRCNGSGMCRVCKQLNAINSMFLTGTVSELAERIIGAYRTFDEVIATIPAIYIKPDDIIDLRKSLHAQIENTRINMNYPRLLEMQFQNAKKLVPRCRSIFENTIMYQINEYEKQNKLRLDSCYFIDDDGFATIDYLDIPDFTGLFLPEQLVQVIQAIRSLFPDFPFIADEIEILADQTKTGNHLRGLLEVHKARVVEQITDCMTNYSENKENKTKLYAIEAILKKYIWTIKFHNKACEKSGNIDLKLSYEIDFVTGESILLVNINQTPENNTLLSHKAEERSE